MYNPLRIDFKPHKQRVCCGFVQDLCKYRGTKRHRRTAARGGRVAWVSECLPGMTGTARVLDGLKFSRRGEGGVSKGAARAQYYIGALSQNFCLKGFPCVVGAWKRRGMRPVGYVSAFNHCPFRLQLRQIETSAILSQAVEVAIPGVLASVLVALYFNH